MKSPDMTGSDYDSVGSGTIQDINDHPDTNLPDPGYAPRAQHSTKMAGDVQVLRPDSPTVNDYAADRQKINERSMKDIAIRGPSAVDARNLKIFPRK